MALNGDISVHNYYDRTNGWQGTNPGWYEVVIYIDDPRESIIRYEDSIKWLKDNIHGYHKHCRWCYAGNHLKYKFRHEKDYLWFNLRWG